MGANMIIGFLIFALKNYKGKMRFYNTESIVILKICIFNFYIVLKSIIGMIKYFRNKILIIWIINWILFIYEFFIFLFFKSGFQFF